MNGKTNEEWLVLVDQALAGNGEALETLVQAMQETVFISAFGCWAPLLTRRTLPRRSC